MKAVKFFAVVPLFAALVLAGTASAQSTPGQEVQKIGSNIHKDANFVTRNVKQDVKDVAHGRIGAAHARHKREIARAHARHRSAVRHAHQRHKTAARCFVRHGHTHCNGRRHHHR